jgi:hypothetical protein
MNEDTAVCDWCGRVKTAQYKNFHVLTCEHGTRVVLCGLCARYAREGYVLCRLCKKHYHRADRTRCFSCDCGSDVKVVVGCGRSEGFGLGMIEDLGIDGIKSLICEDCGSYDTCRLRRK